MNTGRWSFTTPAASKFCSKAKSVDLKQRLFPFLEKMQWHETGQEEGLWRPEGSESGTA